MPAAPPAWLDLVILWAIVAALLLIGGVIGYAVGASAWGPL